NDCAARTVSCPPPRGRNSRQSPASRETWRIWPATCRASRQPPTADPKKNEMKIKPHELIKSSRHAPRADRWSSGFSPGAPGLLPGQESDCDLLRVTGKYHDR